MPETVATPTKSTAPKQRPRTPTTTRATWSGLSLLAPLCCGKTTAPAVSRVETPQKAHAPIVACSRAYPHPPSRPQPQTREQAAAQGPTPGEGGAKPGTPDRRGSLFPLPCLGWVGPCGAWRLWGRCGCKPLLGRSSPPVREETGLVGGLAVRSVPRGSTGVGGLLSWLPATLGCGPRGRLVSCPRPVSFASLRHGGSPCRPVVRSSSSSRMLRVWVFLSVAASSGRRAGACVDGGAGDAACGPGVVVVGVRVAGRLADRLGCLVLVSLAGNASP